MERARYFLLVSAPAPEFAFEVAVVSDVGTEREHNEDHGAVLVESESCGLIAVADGVSTQPGGGDASRRAVDALSHAFAAERGRAGSDKRLYRAAQAANVAVYEAALVVPELRGMATTLTAVVIDRGELAAAHVGDSRLYLVHHGAITQLTKDHTLAGERVRMGLMSEERARGHAGRSVLTRCLGRELIVPIDRLTRRLCEGDLVIVCSDGLYNVLSDDEMARVARGGRDAVAACHALVDAANQRGTPDNVTAAVLRVTGAVPPSRPARLGERLNQLFRARR
jgi:protein phosphatase